MGGRWIYRPLFPGSVAPLFGRASFSLPRRNASRNDFVRIGRYMPADLCLEGKHRKGFATPMDACRDFIGHIRFAIR